MSTIPPDLTYSTRPGVLPSQIHLNLSIILRLHPIDRNVECWRRCAGKPGIPRRTVRPSATGFPLSLSISAGSSLPD